MQNEMNLHGSVEKFNENKDLSIEECENAI